MNLPAELLPDWLMWPALLLAGVVWLWQLRGAPWLLLGQNGLDHVYLGASLLLIGLWALSVGALLGLNVHLLGLTAMVLIFGWRLALVSGGAALLVLALVGVQDPMALGVNAWLTVILPVWVTHQLQRVVYRRLPHHLFVYLIVSAHFVSMVAIAVPIVLGGALLGWLGWYHWAELGREYWVFLPLVVLPEGFFNGAILTMLTIFRPQWVRSFDDREYLGEP